MTETSGKCPSNLNEYKFILECYGSISAGSADMVFCDEWKGTFCVVGFWTDQVFEYWDEVSAFISRYIN